MQHVGKADSFCVLRCGHCKALAPEWKKAAGNLKGKVKLGAVDCTVETSLASKYDVKGFPTILVFGADKQSPQPYEEGRTASAIESYALRVLETTAVAPEVVELTSQVRVPRAIILDVWIGEASFVSRARGSCCGWDGFVGCS